MLKKRRTRGVTLESLASMVKRGFDDADGRFDGVDRQFLEVSRQFREVHARLERIEKLLILDHKRRIERLEEEMKELKELLRIP